MGVKINDEIMTRFGFPLSGMIASCKGAINVVKSKDDNNQTRYRLITSVFYYKDRDGPFIQEEPHKIWVTAEQLDGNLYKIVYDRLKTLYNDTEDV